MVHMHWPRPLRLHRVSTGLIGTAANIALLWMNAPPLL
jgi:hypothetical protein